MTFVWFFFTLLRDKLIHHNIFQYQIWISLYRQLVYKQSI